MISGFRVTRTLVSMVVVPFSSLRHEAGEADCPIHSLAIVLAAGLLFGLSVLLRS